MAVAEDLGDADEALIVHEMKARNLIELQRNLILDRIAGSLETIAKAVPSP